MWEAISSVLTSGNASTVLTFVCIAIAVGVFLVATGRLHIRTKHFMLGIEDRERLVLREQSKWLHTYCLSREGEVLKYANEHGVTELTYGGYFTKYVCERVYDIAMMWAMLNHVTKERAYVDLKKDEIWHLICSLGPTELFQTDDFRKIIDGWTEYMLDNILTIRRIYGSDKGKPIKGE